MVPEKGELIEWSYLDIISDGILFFSKPRRISPKPTYNSPRYWHYLYHYRVCLYHVVLCIIYVDRAGRVDTMVKLGM